MFRAHNFSAGPAILPVEVLQKAQEELVDYRGKGMSLIEMSHRGNEYLEVHNSTVQRFKDILNLGNDFDVLFLQGGASTQFMMVPYNFLQPGQTADYLNTGTWAKKALKEAKAFGNVHVAFSSEAQNFTRVPANNELVLSGKAEYLHFTSNNTIFGTQFRSEPESGGVPLVCDASSDFLSRPIDISRYGLIYAGAQKNLGPAGVTVVIIRKEFASKARKEGVPTMLKYSTHMEDMFNTPPVFAVYFLNLVLEWLQKKGGPEAMATFNEQKAKLIYDVIDQDAFYRPHAEKASRSYMNITFNLPNEQLEKLFLDETKKNQMSGLKGHRSVGGIRASVYNACPMDSAKVLADVMTEFRRVHG